MKKQGPYPKVDIKEEALLPVAPKFLHCIVGPFQEFFHFANFCPAQKP